MNDVLTTLQKLPEMCAQRNPADDSPILIKRGVDGYFPAPKIDPDVYNERRNITPAQTEAMLAGSMFGWDCPAADPDTYDSEGNML